VGDMLTELGPQDARERLEDALAFAVRVRPAGDAREVVVMSLAHVEPKPLRFLWYPYLPLGKVVIVAGAPGHGKSQLTALMAANATRASFYPSNIDAPSRVLILSAEDDLDDTIVPRLLAVNADLRLVDTINVRTTRAGLTYDGLIRLPDDVPAVDDYVRARPDTRLVILDPVPSFFGRSHSTTVNQDVRDALDPLVAVARKYGVTVVVILHLNKSESRDFTTRIAESHGFQAVARTVLALAPDPDDIDGERGSRKVLAITKANLVGAGKFAMRAELRGATVHDSNGQPVDTSYLAITGTADIAAEDLLMSATERTARLEAAEWLADFVGDRWVRIGDLRKAATGEGHSWRTICRVRESGAYQRAKQPGIEHGPWWIASQDNPLPVPGTGALGALDGKDANNARALHTGEAILPGTDANGAKSANGLSSEGPKNKPADLEAYRRHRDAMLGEPWGDDDA